MAHKSPPNSGKITNMHSIERPTRGIVVYDKPDGDAKVLVFGLSGPEGAALLLRVALDLLENPDAF